MVQGSFRIEDNIESPVQEAVRKIKDESAQGKRVVVLADGDPMFFSIGKDNKVLEEAINRLKPDGRLLLHLARMGSLTRVGHYLKSLNWRYSITHVQVSRSKSTAWDQRLEAINPVYIVSATKPMQGPFV